MPFHFTERERGRYLNFQNIQEVEETELKFTPVVTESHVHTSTYHTAYPQALTHECTHILAPIDGHSHLTHIPACFVCLHAEHCPHLVITHRHTQTYGYIYLPIHIHSFTHNPFTHTCRHTQSMFSHSYTHIHPPFWCRRDKLTLIRDPAHLRLDTGVGATH